MRITLKTFGVTALLSISLGTSFDSRATPGQPGSLDATWGNASAVGAGRVVSDVGGQNDFATAITLQPDGKVVIAGYCVAATPDFCALRYNTDGTLDLSFGNSGKVITPIGSYGDAARAVIVQSDGKLVLAGSCYNGSAREFCMLRYTANGALDVSFGNSGTVITPRSGGDDFANALALQPDGKLVVGGYCKVAAQFKFCAVRYNSDGTIDANFGNNGRSIGSIGNGFDLAQALALQPDGKLLLAGECSLPSVVGFCALRYNTNGTVDTTFGINGSVITTVGSGYASATSIALQPDGNLVLAGYCDGTGNKDFCALRYDASGALDTGFGNGGTVVIPIGNGADIANTAALQPDGKLIIAGHCEGVSNFDICALRTHANGVLDASFGNNGRVMTSVGSDNDAAYAAALQPDGKLVLAGQCSNGADLDFCAARYEGGPFGYKNCSLDIDGDNRVLATTDSLIHARIALGITGNAVTNGISFPPTATRNTWPLIRDYLVSQCGMSLVQ